MKQIHYLREKENSISSDLVLHWVKLLKQNNVAKVTKNYILIPSTVFIELIGISLPSDASYLTAFLHGVYTQKYNYTYIRFK